MVDLEKLLSRMTLDEKIAMLAGKDSWHTVPIPRLGIPSIKMTDGPNGARGALGNLGPSSALFPVGMALGATWNRDLVEKIGAALAEEVRAKGAHILLAPTVNIHRTPIAGRNFECYSEDPYLSGQLASAYIRGLQGNGTGACIKHFVCNDQEFERKSISAQVEERPLREIYLEPFRLAIRSAKPWAVMSAYNRINGRYASENDTTLKLILKGEWGFDGVVMSDWGGTYTPEVSSGGLDLEMPGPALWMSADHVRQALASGALSESALDDKVRRLLRTIARTGAFERPALQDEAGQDRPEHRRLIREAARETIVLLTNRKILPLSPKKARTIAVIGQLARWPNVLGGGSSKVTPHYVVSPLEGIRARVGEHVTVEYSLGCLLNKRLPVPDLGCLQSEDGRQGLTLRIYDNLDFSGRPAYEKVTDRLAMEWFGDPIPNVEQRRFCISLTGTFTAREGGEHTFSLASVGQSRLFMDGEILLDNWRASGSNEELTVVKKLAAGQSCSLKIEYRWEGENPVRSLRLGHLPPHRTDPISKAVRLAKKADVVILVAGLTGEWESEGFDRVDMDLPGDQDELIEKVASANPNTIVVLNTGSAVRMPWAEKVAAILEQWYNSQECGHALAEVLFGDVSPSGKLPTTFPRRLEDNPAFLNYPGENGKVLYGEGLFVGYRYYDTKDVAPLFPFGHGLSYAQFEYGPLSLRAGEFTAEEGLDVHLKVTNTGKRPGKEIVQLYVHDVSSALVRPEKELKAFAKVALAPGEGKAIDFHLDREAFWYFNPAQGGWVTEPGEFEILVGASSRDIRSRASARLIPSRTSQPRLHTPKI